jgi:hypothetical protein
LTAYGEYPVFVPVSLIALGDSTLVPVVLQRSKSRTKLNAVPEQNVELHRCAIQAFNVRDVEASIALSDPEVEVYSAFAAVGGAVYHGHDGTRSFFVDLEDTWDEISVEPEEYFDLGAHTLLFYVVHGRGKQSGADVTGPAAQVAKWRDGLLDYLKGYVSRKDALRDLGVSEDELEPIAP